MATTTTQRQDLIAELAMLKEAAQNWDVVPPKMAAAITEREERLAALGDSEGLRTTVHGEGTARPLHARPQAGAPASNQYGTFTVAYASPAQTRFIEALLNTKDLSSLADSVTLDVAKLREQVAAQQVNKKAASAILDRLLALPDRAATPNTPTGRPASDKQYAFIASLAAEKDLADDDRAKVMAAVEGKTLSAKGASATIEKLQGLPKATRKTATRDIEAGVWVNTDGTIFRAYLGQQSGQMLCKRVVDGDFEYAGKAERFIKADARKMTIEEAAAWGKTTGTCIVCGRRLDDPESVDRGIGPVCFAKMAE